MTSRGLLSSKLDVMVSVLRGSGIKKDYDFDVKDEVLLHTTRVPSFGYHYMQHPRIAPIDAHRNRWGTGDME
jgi:hypothetical protein